MGKEKREHTETLLVENDVFVLKLVSSQRVLTQRKTQRGQLRGPDGEQEMQVSMDAGEHEIYEIVHTLRLTGTGDSLNSVTLHLTPVALSLLVQTLQKAPSPAYAYIPPYSGG